LAYARQSKTVPSPVLDRFRRALRLRGPRLRAEPFEGRHVESLAGFRALLAELQPELDRRRALETSLAEHDEQFLLDGRCAVCARPTRFWVDRLHGFPAGGARWPQPNWRERMSCEHCQLNNRMRAAIHYLLAFGRPRRQDAVYLTERVTPLFEALQRLLPRTVGSEFLGADVAPGSVDARGVRHETLARLSFGEASFRYLLTFDVLEHVPDTCLALAECMRVLKPGGLLVFTVPFDFASERTLVRASLRGDGSIVHHVEPEFHGDPLNREGILSYYTFGWDLLQQLGAHGFEQARAFVYWSQPLGYLGVQQVLFSARRK
jgi:hypothetical protein